MRTITLYATAVIAGAGVWIGIGLVTGVREAWDSPLYFSVGMPVLFVATALLGAIEPTAPWRWGVVVVVPQAIIGAIQAPSLNLWPLSLVFLGILCGMFSLSSYAGAWLSRYASGGKTS